MNSYFFNAWALWRQPWVQKSCKKLHSISSRVYVSVLQLSFCYRTSLCLSSLSSRSLDWKNAAYVFLEKIKIYNDLCNGIWSGYFTCNLIFLWHDLDILFKCLFINKSVMIYPTFYGTVVAIIYGNSDIKSMTGTMNRVSRKISLKTENVGCIYYFTNCCGKLGA